MAPQFVRLPDGQIFTVTPVFAGLSFKSHEWTTPHSHIPIGWTIVLRTEDNDDDHIQWNMESRDKPAAETDEAEEKPKRHAHAHAFRQPTLQNDTVFISSINIPSSSEFKAPASPTRQIAMMMWVTLYWYFHQPAPAPQLNTATARQTEMDGRPHGEWRINIKKDGVLRGKNLLPKLERMGLIASMNNAVGLASDDSDESWSNMFVSRRAFWQTPGRLFIFTLQRNPTPSYPASPGGSRPGSPSRSDSPQPQGHHYRHSSSASPRLGAHRGIESEVPVSPMPSTMGNAPHYIMSQYVSTSHLPTYFPPAAYQYVMTNNIRHPLRPKPPRFGETFYSRFVPSVGQYLSFRVASSSSQPVPYLGPIGPSPPTQAHLTSMSDTELLQSWMSKPRVSKFWGDFQPDFLENNLKSRHSFPAIGMWDGVPFGYFEIYWVKEDLLGQYLSGDANDWDRGFHVFIGEEWARGKVSSWATALCHWCFGVDYRTMNVCLEPRVDNKRFVETLVDTGFSKEKQLSFPHKQSWFIRMRRDMWEGPAL